MENVWSPVRRAALREFSALSSVIHRATRWSSTIQVIKRYVELRTYLLDLNCSEVNEIMLDRKEDLILDRLCSKLSDLSSICKRLQQDPTTLSDARALFGTVIDHHLESTNLLSCDATIV